MVRYENDCVDCGLPCLGESCPNRNVPHYYCDACGDETQLYEYEGQQLCIGCIERMLPKVMNLTL